MIKSICINDKNRPKEVPQNLWIKENNPYTIEYIYRSLNPNSFNELMVELKEVKMNDSCLPFQFYRLDRFAISQDSLEEFLMLCKTCAEFNDIEISRLLEENISVCG